MLKKHHVFMLIVVVVLIVYINLSFYQKSFAFIGFGGMTVQPATPICTNGRFLLINERPFILPITAKIYSYGIIIPFVKIWSLGSYTPGGVCVQPFPLPPIPVIGTINIIGTSLPS